MFGRNGESPVPVLAPRSPADCFAVLLDAARIALTHRTPVVVLSDGAIANGSEPWQIPRVVELPDLSVRFASQPNAPDGSGRFWPYLRDPATLARPWAVPGCSSRFPYCLGTYGMHSIHGRAPAIATGLTITRPDLSVWVVTGDGDALSIGGNHLVHALRRNVNLKILLFNNRVYGLTKGQYSPTSEPGKITKSSPDGSVDHPFDPMALAIGAGATFVARPIDSDRAGLSEVLTAAARHRGTALVEIYQNCPIFNEGAFALLKEPGVREHHLIPVRHGEPVTFGPDRGDGPEYGLVRDPATGGVSIRKTADVAASTVVTHDATATEPWYALSLACLPGTVTGVIRDVARPTYDDQVRAQNRRATDTRAFDLEALLTGTEPWTVGQDPVS
jgi:2-oxoglutarate/2-oxoacid ferredoxin oxidoreductase subunit beta